jgi:hypothetical protein
MDKELMRQILLALRNDPYTRQRYIASACHVWLCSERFLDTMQYMFKCGLIDCVSVNDPAQMEYFNLWYLTDDGERAIMTIENRKGDNENG